jgi:hypothetical protein
MNLLKMLYSASIKKEIECFRLSTRRLSDKINGASDLWKDANYASLQSKMNELAQHSKTVIHEGESACRNIDVFFNIALENI